MTPHEIEDLTNQIIRCVSLEAWTRAKRAESSILLGDGESGPVNEQTREAFRLPTSGGRDLVEGSNISVVGVGLLSWIALADSASDLATLKVKLDDIEAKRAAT